MESYMKLKQTLTSMVDVHQILLELAKEKQTILVDGDITKLQNLISKENKCTEIIGHLEEQRERQISDFLVERGFSIQSLTMDEFIKLVNDTEEKSILTEITKQLKGMLMEISQLNKNNQKLIQMALSYIQYSVNILMPKEPVIGYGMKSAAPSIKFLDAKV